MSYLLIWIGEELTRQMKKYKEAVEETAVYWYLGLLVCLAMREEGFI